MKILGAVVLLSAGMFVAGCKSAPELTEAQALSLIQAKYDQDPATGASIMVNKLGMSMGITDGYWKLTKVYPNRFWADYTLTDEGKKALTPPGGGDVIQWRPGSMDDPSYSITIMTKATNHLKARDLRNLHDETLPGVETAKGATFNESVDLTDVPGPLQDIAHNPGNKLTTKRTVDFELAGGAWKLHGIQ
ncbi:MAG: hypothetical protein KGM96_05215 [Acidobacteriota bacterium]|nr:hypothetical protein [Acidobacteriota bacterium]